MSFKTYRAIDLCIMMAIIVLGELLISFASNAWFKLNSLGVSIVFPMLLIIAMRWGWLVAIPAVVGGAISCFFSQLSGGQAMTPTLLLISEVGTLSTLLSLVWFKFVGKQKTKDSWLLSLAYVCLMYLIYSVFCGIVTAIVNGKDLLGCMVLYFTRDSITLLFSVVVVLITRKLDGVFEDQKTYLLRQEKQREEEKAKKQKNENN